MFMLASSEFAELAADATELEYESKFSFPSGISPRLVSTADL